MLLFQEESIPMSLEINFVMEPDDQAWNRFLQQLFSLNDVRIRKTLEDLNLCVPVGGETKEALPGTWPEQVTQRAFLIAWNANPQERTPISVEPLHWLASALEISASHVGNFLNLDSSDCRGLLEALRVELRQ